VFGLHTEVHDCCFAAEHVVDADIVDADIRFCRSCEQSRVPVADLYRVETQLRNWLSN